MYVVFIKSVKNSFNYESFSGSSESKTQTTKHLVPHSMAHLVKSLIPIFVVNIVDIL